MEVTFKWKHGSGITLPCVSYIYGLSNDPVVIRYPEEIGRNSHLPPGYQKDCRAKAIHLMDWLEE
jgi:hypothetical protein